MLMVLTYSTLLMLLLTMLSILLYGISMKSFFDREKSSPFECGFNPISSPRIPFSSHFFLIAVIFLVFDVELVVIMPMVVCLPYNNMLDVYMIMFIFLFVLIIGLAHEWNNKMLDWM
uniref:NADH-ubiquinone oxidoreductase chain 3 n=1 Tax=Okanagana rimosa TaxID=1464975 RepID=A0A3S7MEX9_9HEMI|nr:NADH dehydrogenase subunit 3 [Okanagana rimosa]